MFMRVGVVGAGSWGTTVAHPTRTPIADQMRTRAQEGRTALEAYASLVNTPAAREIDPH